VQVDALAVRVRPRTPLEAADLGPRLVQSIATSVYSCYAMAAIPIVALALASYEVATWLPTLALWWSKPWLDRTVLFVLARAAFGQPTAPGDVWHAQRQVWWSQLLHTWTLRRLSPWRSYTQPVYQLEGLSVWRARKRVLQIRGGGRGGPAFLMTSAFSSAETALAVAVTSLAFWLAPVEQAPSFTELFLAGDGTGLLALLTPISYTIVVLFLEPFYVAAGFAMYLNRRAELEAWDIEQELRRAFAA
jgi:hypothetical protein